MKKATDLKFVGEKEKILDIIKHLDQKYLVTQDCTDWKEDNRGNGFVFFVKVISKEVNSVDTKKIHLGEHVKLPDDEIEDLELPEDDDLKDEIDVPNFDFDEVSPKGKKQEK